MLVAAALFAYRGADMASTYGSAHTICPYFVRDYSRSIACEGWGGDDEILHRFRDVPAKCAHQRRYCFGYGYDRCPIARLAAQQTEKATEK